MWDNFEWHYRQSSHKKPCSRMRVYAFTWYHAQNQVVIPHVKANFLPALSFHNARTCTVNLVRLISLLMHGKWNNWLVAFVSICCDRRHTRAGRWVGVSLTHSVVGWLADGSLTSDDLRGWLMVVQRAWPGMRSTGKFFVIQAFRSPMVTGWLDLTFVDDWGVCGI